MRLTEEERLHLARRLFEGVNDDFAPEWEAAWGEEIARRIAEMDSGAVKLVPWTEVKRLMQAARDGAY